MPQAVPVDYQSTVKKPDDFDAFWDGVQQQATAIPLEPEMIPDPVRTSAEVDALLSKLYSMSLLQIWRLRISLSTMRMPPCLQ